LSTQHYRKLGAFADFGTCDQWGVERRFDMSNIEFWLTVLAVLVPAIARIVIAWGKLTGKW